MAVEVGKVLGRLADGWWAQVHDFMTDGEKAHKRGHLIACTSLHQPQLQELAAVETGREVLARLHELYYGNLDPDPLTTLRQAVTTVGEEFAGCEIVALANLGEALYVVVWGSGGVWTRQPAGQGRQEGWIVNPQSVQTRPMALSGWIKPGQIVVAGNSQFWRAITLGTVRAAVANNTHPTELAESLATVVHGSDMGIGGVGVVMQIPYSVSQIPKIDTGTKIIDRLRTKLAKFIPKPTGPIFISEGDKNMSRRRNMYVGIGFLLLLLLLVGGWQWRRTYMENKLGVRNQRIEEVVHKFNEAQSLAQLNPVRSRQLLAEVSASLPQLKNTGKTDERIAQIEASFGQVLGVASGVKSDPAQEVLDLDWLRSGMTGSQLGLVESKLVVLDTAGGRLAVIDPAKKSGVVISGKTDLGETKLMAVYPGKITVLSDKGIVECSLTGSCKIVIPPDSTWGQVMDMQMFAGNIYLLTQNNILRYQVTDEGYGVKQKWLADTENGLSQSLNMAIDASVWIMQTTGQILKYTRGVKENFAVTDLDKPFTPGVVIYTDSEASQLYVLDWGNSRVVVLAKTGAYQLQYQFDQAREASDIVVDELGGAMYLLAGSKIYSIKL